MEEWGNEFGTAYGITKKDLPTVLVLDGERYFRDASICGVSPKQSDVEALLHGVEEGSVAWGTTGRFLEKIIKGWQYYPLWQQVSYTVDASCAFLSIYEKGNHRARRTFADDSCLAVALLRCTLC